MNIEPDNILLNTDSYKASHWLQYPPGTENVFSYVESRGGKYDRTLFFGLQILLKSVLTKPITEPDIVEAAQFWAAHGEPFNEEGWRYILKQHGGYLPVRIRAVPEGMVIPVSNVLMTIEATDEKCYWLPSYLETMLLRACWYGTTVATNSWHIRKMILKFLEETGDPAGIDFKLHDFGARGVSSFESAGIGGAAHLATGAMGTDTVTGALFAMKYYHQQDMVAFSIPAAEHSTITSWGQENEARAYLNMIRKYSKPGAAFAVVSDSYDIYHASKNIWGEELKAELLDSGGMLIIRPDSGHPATVVMKVLRILEDKFGATENAKRYKVLNHVRLIQGDGVNASSIREILNWMKGADYSADNIAFGMGGGMLQQLDRDTQKFAMKCSAIKINGMWHDVWKDPVDDPGKKSKRGRISLFTDPLVGIATAREDLIYAGKHREDLMRVVFENGRSIGESTFAEIRARANQAL